MFISPYLTNPPVSKPETINAGTGAGPDGEGGDGKAPFVVEVESGDGIDVEVQLSAGSASYRPYYWKPITGHAESGVWIPIGGDAASSGTGGAGPTSASASYFGGAANGRYQGRPGRRKVILVREANTDSALVFASVESRRTVLEG